MKALLLLFCGGAAAFAVTVPVSGTIERRNFDKSHRVYLEVVDAHPAAIRIDDSAALALRYEGTYGSAEDLPTEYFKAGALTVVVSYTADPDDVHYHIGGVTLHGSHEGQRYDGMNFSWSTGLPDPLRFTSRGGAAPHGRGRPFCLPAPDLKGFEDADCLVTISDVYEPRDKWSIFFYAVDYDRGYLSGASFSPAKFDGDPPDCVRAGACVFYVGRLKYWRKKWTEIAVEIRLRNGLPESALAHDLETYRGRITR